MDEQRIQPESTPVPPTVPSTNEAQARTWNMWCHLSALSVLVGVPFGNVLGPLLIWQMKKSEFPSLDVHGKAALNFQLTVTIAAVVVGMICPDLHLHRRFIVSGCASDRPVWCHLRRHCRHQGQ